MKKTTAFFLTIGVLAMIIGGIGSAVYFNRAQNTMTDTKKQSYEIKNKQSPKDIHLNLSGNADFYILTENSNKVIMNTHSSLPVSLDSSLDVKETKDQLTISTTSEKQKKELNRLKFDLFDRGSAVTLTIPDDAERIIIDGKATGTVHLSEVKTKDLSVKLDLADIDLNYTSSEKLTVETTNADINIYSEVRTDEATFNTTNGDIEINDFAASNWSASSKSGDIYVNTVKGSTKLSTVNGDIQATDLKGDAEIESVNGSFSLYGTAIPKKLLAETQQGDIQLHTEEIVYDVTIKAKTKLGDSTIFGKERTSYKRGKGSKSFELQTNSGDILVEGPSDYEDGEED